MDHGEATMFRYLMAVQERSFRSEDRTPWQDTYPEAVIARPVAPR